MTTRHQDRVQKAARRKRGRVKTLKSDSLQPLVVKGETRKGIRHLPAGGVETRREQSFQKLTASQEEALSWVKPEWESPQEIVERTGKGQMVVRNHLRRLAQKGRIERCLDTGRVRRVEASDSETA